MHNCNWNWVGESVGDFFSETGGGFGGADAGYEVGGFLELCVSILFFRGTMAVDAIGYPFLVRGLCNIVPFRACQQAAEYGRAKYT